MQKLYRVYIALYEDQNFPLKPKSATNHAKITTSITFNIPSKVCSWKSFVNLVFILKVVLDSFLLEHEAEKRPKFKNMLRTYPRLRKGKELLFWILHKVTAIIVSRLNVCHCNIIYSVVLLNIFFYKLLSFFLVCLCFRLVVRMQNNNCTSNTNNSVSEHFKNIWGWSPQILKNIQPQPKN